MTSRSSPVWRQLSGSPPPAAPREAAELVIVGGGPVGLTLALDLGLRNRRVLLLNRRDFIPGGSKAICFAKQALDTWDRLGVGARMVEAGVVWNVGKVFWRDGEEPVYRFDMLPVKHQKNPGFINLQQYRVEEILVEALEELPNVEIRWGHRVAALETGPGGAALSVEAGDALYRLDADWVVACDGAGSPVRSMLGLDFEGRIFEENFLIADVRLEADRASERWFWFDPPFNPGKSALLHKQPDNLWRLDFQLGWDVDREEAVRPERVEPLVRGLLGEDVAFEPEWYSVYTFQCRRMRSFVHGRVLFAGDSAHLVSPFGARGCNGGLADANGLGWRLDAILSGEAGPELLQSYDLEATATADDNIRNSSRSTDFITPKTPAATALRDAVLELARSHSFARPFVNSGRLFTATAHPDSPLNTPDEEEWDAGVAPGSPAIDAPWGEGWLLERMGSGFTLLSMGGQGPVPGGVARLDLTSAGENAGLVLSRYGLSPGGGYLIRPDQVVAARWKRWDCDRLSRALGTALAS